MTIPRPARLALRRRSFAEQRVIRLLRGEESERTALYAGQFAKLRALAGKNGLVIQSPGCPYLTVDELRLLAWLAQAQRVLGYTRAFHPDGVLTLTIVHCAGTLDAVGIRLPPLAMCNAPGAAVSGGTRIET